MEKEANRSGKQVTLNLAIHARTKTGKGEEKVRRVWPCGAKCHQ